MRWQTTERIPPPKPGDVRTRKKFLLFPKGGWTYNGYGKLVWERRWLERAIWNEKAILVTGCNGGPHPVKILKYVEPIWQN